MKKIVSNNTVEKNFEQYKDFLSKAIDYVDDEYYQWYMIDKKEVYDFDGFLTEYSLWVGYNKVYDSDIDDSTIDINSPLFVCIFGDTDLYDPTNYDFDWETESYKEAVEFFENYE